MNTTTLRSQTKMTWLTLLASVLVLFVGRLAPLQLPLSLERTFLSLQTHIQNETPAKIESAQQLRVAGDISNQTHPHISAVVPRASFVPVSHPFHFARAAHLTQVSRLLSLQPRSRSPPLQIV